MRRFASTCVLVFCCATAHAQDARGLAAGCTACHSSVVATRGGNRPLAGMPRDELARAMRAYRAGERAGTLMPQLAKGYNDAEIDAIAGWYAALPRSP